MSDFQPAREQMAWVETLQATFAYSDLFAKYVELVGLKIVSVAMADHTLTIAFHDGRSLTIDDQGHQCCERRWMTCDDDLSGHEGGQLLSIDLNASGSSSDDGGDQQFVRVQTTKGSFTLCTHNEHNGYYGGFQLVAELHALPEPEPEVDSSLDYSERWRRERLAMRPIMARWLWAARADLRENPVTPEEMRAVGLDPGKDYRKGSLHRWLTFERAAKANKTWRLHPQTKAEQAADEILPQLSNHQRRMTTTRPKSKRPVLPPPPVVPEGSNVVAFPGKAA